MSGIGVVGSETTAVLTQNGTMAAVNPFQSYNPVVFGSVLGGVEQALGGARILEATGWTLTKNLSPEYCDPCYLTPSFDLYPKVGERPLMNTDNRLQMEIDVVPDCSCCICFSQREKGWRRYSIQNAGVELVSFRYRPRLFHCSGYKVKDLEMCLKQRSVNIFIPQRSERIGCIEMTGDFEERITDDTTGSVFVVSKCIPDNKHELMSASISNNVGNPAVICRAINGIKEAARGGSVMVWQEFAMEYLPPMASTTLSTRAALVVAFHMWVLMHFENGSRWSISSWIVMFLTIVCGVLVFLLLIIHPLG